MAEESGVDIRIRKGWNNEGKEGCLLAGPIRDLKGQDWMVIQWSGDDDPDLHKAAGLEMKTATWTPVK